MAKARIKDIAKEAGVSVGTVDRVLHNRGEVAESTKIKILDLVKKYNYHPNLSARALTSKKPYTFASLLPSNTPEDTFWEKPLNGILSAVDELEQFQVELEQFFFDQYDVEDFKHQTHEIIKLSPSGVILPPFFKKESLEFTKQLDKHNIPYVFIDSYLQESNFLGFVGEDGFQGGRVAAQLVDYTIDRHSDILIISMAKGIENVHHLNQRTQGFLSYFIDRSDNTGKKINLEIQSANPQAISLKLDPILKKNANIKAIFVTGSKAYKIANYLVQHQLEDITLVGFDPVVKNVGYLKDGVIDFLIGQRPFQQGFRGVRRLFDHVVLTTQVEKVEFLPIDIISRENINLYQPK